MKKIKQFELMKGEENEILPGNKFEIFMCDVNQDSIVIHDQDGKTYTIFYFNMENAEFSEYRYKQNLWFRCLVKGKKFSFCTTPRMWKTTQGKLLINRMSYYIPIRNKDALETYKHSAVFCFIFGFILKLID